MKRVMLGVGFALFVQTASAAVEYEFRQVTHSDLESVGAADFTGRAVIDGDRSRIDFLTGTGYPTGTYLISSNGSRSLTFVDPKKKSYLEVNAGTVATTLGSAKISITNKKVDFSMLDDHPIIAGLPTDHHRMSIRYDITLALGTLELKQQVNAVQDRYVTTAFGDVAETFLGATALKTGNPELDELVDLENRKVHGFTLRQVVSTTTTNSRPGVPGSQLKIANTMTTTREITVTSISPRAAVPAAMFMVPVGYQKAETMKDDSQKTPINVLSMEPPKGE
jgi:hypothetical protein